MRAIGARKLVAATGCAALMALLAVSLLYREDIRWWWVLRKDFEGLGRNTFGYSEYRHRQTGIVFVRLPGGSFWMGSSEEEGKEVVEHLVRREGEEERDSIEEEVEREQPRHQVTLSPFLIAKYEVSQEEWLKVMPKNFSYFQPGGKAESHFRIPVDPSDDWLNLPVDAVTWPNCREFCQRTGLSLPTEVQWEYACRAGSTTEFAFGRSITTDQVNYNGERPYGDAPPGIYRKRTVSVNALEPNDFGIYNMHGNVWEWCRGTLDPTDLLSSFERVIRGGSFLDEAVFCRSAYRSQNPRHDVRVPTIGIRPVYNPQD